MTTDVEQPAARIARLLKPTEVAAILSVHEKTVRDLLNRGELPGRRVGKYWRVDEDALRAWIKDGAASNVVSMKRRGAR